MGCTCQLTIKFYQARVFISKNSKTTKKKGFRLSYLVLGLQVLMGIAKHLMVLGRNIKFLQAIPNADRKNFEDASDFIGWYIDGSYRLLKLNKSDVYNHYLAYHEGRGGYQKKSFNKKKWLLEVAKKVERQAKEYSSQIKKCNFHKKSVF